MHVTGGKYKGRKLVYPSFGLRPTTAMARQAMFNMCAPMLAGAKVLDLFAGAGALGIEALSRGAASAQFIERDPRVLVYLRRNIAGIDHARSRAGDVLRLVNRLAGEGFDLVFADPPYLKGLVQKTVDTVCSNDVLAPDGWLVVEHHRGEPVTPDEGWEVLKQGTYGETVVTVVARRGAEPRASGDEQEPESGE